MKKKKLVACLFLVLILVTVFNPLTIKAAVNTLYSEVEVDQADNELAFGPTIAQWIGQFIYTIAHGVENIGAGLMKIFTGNYVFPYSDKIIFNTIPILDVNFINPAYGSFFKDTEGKWTQLGSIVRNMYFTVLALSLSFLTLVIGVAALRMAISTIMSEKAKYKEAITNALTCVILLFGMHYLLSFTFYVNEKLVEVASSALKSMLTTEGEEFVQSLKGLADENNEAIAENFTKVATENCFLSKIPIVGTLYQGLLDTIHAIGHAIGKVWSWLTGGNDKETEEITQEELGKMYPNKEDYAEAILKDETRKNVAAYLLKQEYYRKTYLKWIKGNDTNSLNKGGLSGVARNILITVNDVLGVADTGYKALRTLYTSVLFVTFVPKDDDDLPYKSTLDEAVEKNHGNPKGNKKDEKGNNVEELSDSQVKNYKLDKGQFISSQINSTEDYIAYKDAIQEELLKIQKEETDKDAAEEKKLACYLNEIYADAYYIYVYDGTDKVKPTTDEFVSELGNYFKQTSWYIDTEGNDWSPTTINFLSVLCYGIFIIQSLMFLFAYAKRFFYVIILSMFGPVIVVYDYMSKSI